MHGRRVAIRRQDRGVFRGDVAKRSARKWARRLASGSIDGCQPKRRQEHLCHFHREILLDACCQVSFPWSPMDLFIPSPSRPRRSVVRWYALLCPGNLNRHAISVPTDPPIPSWGWTEPIETGHSLVSSFPGEAGGMGCPDHDLIHHTE